MKKNLQRGLVSFLGLILSLSAIAQNQVYWREGFELGAAQPNTFPTAAPVAGNIAASAGHYQSNAGTWYVYGAYRSNGSASNNCSAVVSGIGIAHVRFSNQVTSPDSAYIITPVVNFGVQELHFMRTRSGRSYSIWRTDDTAAVGATWVYSAFVANSTNVCSDTIININSATAKRVKIVARPAVDTDIDSVWLTSYTSLPVELAAYTGKNIGKINELNWMTATEVNNREFVIERSLNGVDFRPIGTVKGNGTTNVAKNYNFIDGFAPNMAYYRLKQVDIDGKENLSKVVTIENTNAVRSSNIKVYPAVATDIVSVDIPTEGNTDLIVTDLMGRTVLVEKLGENKGFISHKLDISALNNGFYFVSVKTGAIQTTVKFEKNK